MLSGASAPAPLNHARMRCICSPMFSCYKVKLKGVEELYEGAAQLGHHVAARKIGFMALQFGQTDKAEIYLRQAAAAGDREAADLLAEHLAGLWTRRGS